MWPMAELGTGFQPWGRSSPSLRDPQCPSTVDGQSKPHDSKKANYTIHEGAPAVGRAQELSDWLLVTSFERCYWLPLNGNIVMMVMVKAVLNRLALSWAPWSPQAIQQKTHLSHFTEEDKFRGEVSQPKSQKRV